MCMKNYGVESIIHFFPRVKYLIITITTLLLYDTILSKDIRTLVGTLITENKVKFKLTQKISTQNDK